MIEHFVIRTAQISIYQKTLFVAENGTKENIEENFVDENGKALRIPQSISDSADALTISPVMDKVTKEIGVLVWLKDGASLQTIVHESVHAATGLFQMICADVDVENDEPFAYLVAFLFDKISTLYKM